MTDKERFVAAMSNNSRKFCRLCGWPQTGHAPGCYETPPKSPEPAAIARSDPRWHIGEEGVATPAISPPRPPPSAPRVPWAQRMELAVSLPKGFQWCPECAAAVVTCQHAGWGDSCGPKEGA